MIRENRMRCLNVSSDIFKDMGPRLYELVLKFCWVAMLEMGKQDGWSTKHQLQEISEAKTQIEPEQESFESSGWRNLRTASLVKVSRTGRIQCYHRENHTLIEIIRMKSWVQFYHEIGWISNMHELPKGDYKLLGATRWRASWCDSHNAYSPEPIWWSCRIFFKFNLTWRDEENCVVAALNKIQGVFPLLEDLSHMAISHETMIFI